MTDSEKLLPCPWCGKPGKIVRNSDHHGEFFNLGCRAELVTFHPCPGAMIYYTEPIESLPSAITAWNTRTPAEAELREAFEAGYRAGERDDKSGGIYHPSIEAGKYVQAWRARKG